MGSSKVTRVLVVCVVFMAATLSGCAGGDSPTDEGEDPSITISLGNSSVTIEQDDDGTVSVTVGRGGGYNGNVSLSITGAPAGVTATADPASIPAGSTTGTVTLAVSASVDPGTYSLTVGGSGSGVADVSAALDLTVTEKPGFSFSLSPTDLSIDQDSQESSTASFTRTGGFSGGISLSVSGAPDGMTTSADPASATGNSSILTISVDEAVSPGQYDLTVTATASGLPDQTANLSVTVVEVVTGSFSLALDPPSLSVPQGGTGTTTVELTREGGFAGDVSLAVSGMPSGVTASADPATTSGASSTVTVTVGAGAAAGDYTLTVEGTADGLTDQSADLALTVTASTGGEQVTWVFCEDSGVPLWVAFKDGSGAWTQVTGANNTYEFEINSDVAGIAFVTQDDGGNFDSSIFYATRDELNTLGTGQCSSPDETTRTVNGSVAGLALTDQANVTLGGASASVAGTGPLTFTLDHVPEGMLDLIASKVVTQVSGSDVTLSVDKLIFRRGLDPADGATLSVLDFGGSEAFDPVIRDLTVNNVGTDQAAVNMSYVTANGVSSTFFGGLGGGGSQSYPGVPAAQQEADDLHLLNISAAPESDPVPYIRNATVMFKEAENKTVELGPPLNGVTLSTSVTPPNVRPRAQYTVQAEYDEFWTLSFSQSAANAVTIFVTRGYQGGSTSFNYGVPEFSGVAGWDNAWGLAAGTETEWVLSAAGWTGSGGIIFAPYSEGGTFMSSLRSGTISP